MQGCSPWHGPRAMEEAKVCGSSHGQPSPLPLVHGVSGSVAVVKEQPCDLSTLTQRYADFGASFIKEQSAAKKPWYLFASFSHVHVTDANYSTALPPPGYSPWQFSSKKFCGSSGRGGTGDAVQELDDAVGQLMAAVLAAGVDDNTITFFTSDNGNPEYGDMRGNLPLASSRPDTCHLLQSCLTSVVFCLTSVVSRQAHGKGGSVSRQSSAGRATWLLVPHHLHWRPPTIFQSPYSGASELAKLNLPWRERSHSPQGYAQSVVLQHVIASSSIAASQVAS
jgi:hypothetical protein